MVAVIIGEGGSGGALGLAAATRVLMLEHSYYSVITPEAGSSTPWTWTPRGRTSSPRCSPNSISESRP